MHVVPQKQIVDVGSATKFTCRASGHPITKYTWTRNGEKMIKKDKNKLETESHELVIDSVEIGDGGMYQCFVSNDRVVVQAIAQLSIGSM